MAHLASSVVVIPEESSRVVHVPALPGCVAEWRFIEEAEEALAMAQEAIGLWLHRDVPHPEPAGTNAVLATVAVDVEIGDGVVRTPGVTEPTTAEVLRS
jgi:predicted RNase H-like HicB family nuclease